MLAIVNNDNYNATNKTDNNCLARLGCPLPELVPPRRVPEQLGRA